MMTIDYTNRSCPLGQLYQDIILEHSKDPRNFGSLEKPDRHQEGFNPLCGDRVILDLKFDSAQNTLCQIRFKGEGCSICMASASMMTEEVCNQELSCVLKKIEQIRNLMQGKGEVIEGDLEALSGVKNFPVRIKCALLPWTTLKQALEETS